MKIINKKLKPSSIFRYVKESKPYRYLYFNQHGFKYIKIHGLLRTGTNYLSELLKMNFKTKVFDTEEFGWKHGPVFYDFYCNYAIIIKNPYSWFLSFKNWEEIHGRIENTSLYQFLNRPISHKILSHVWEARNPIDVWNKAMNSWIQYENTQNTVLIKYEDLITKFPYTMKIFQKKFNIKMKKSKFQNISERADTWRTPNPRKEMRLQYYINEEYLKEYSSKEKIIIRDNIDKEITQKLGYTIL